MKPFVIIFLINIFCISKVSACTCDMKPSVNKNWEYATDVFIGEVLEIDTSGQFYNSYGAQVTLFKVRIIESLKNKITKGDEYRTFIYSNSGNCASYFKSGQKYLIYASHTSQLGFLMSSICSRTAPIEYVENIELEELRALYQKENSNKEIHVISPPNHATYENNLLSSINEQLNLERKIWIVVSSVLAVIVIILFIVIYRMKR